MLSKKKHVKLVELPRYKFAWLTIKLARVEDREVTNVGNYLIL